MKVPVLGHINNRRDLWFHFRHPLIAHRVRTSIRRGKRLRNRAG